ncbi:EMB2076, partial [Symbiodinium pilosum]
QIGADVISYNAAISACNAGGMWQQAVDLLMSLDECMIQADRISYNAAISACEKNQEWLLALRLLLQAGER